MNLTDRQNKIVNVENHTDNKKIVCLASAGSGKSTVVENRVQHLIQTKNIDPSKITLFSFSRAATKEIRTRLKKNLGRKIFSNLNISTIHSFCYHIVRNHLSEDGPVEINIFSQAQMYKTVQTFIDNAQSFDIYFGADPSAFMNDLSTIQKNNLKLEFFQRGYSELYRLVSAWMKKRSLYTFDDILYLAFHILDQSTSLKNHYSDLYEYWFIDEAQDTTRIMLDLVSLLMKDETKILLSFDIIQSLYQFAGADPFYLMDFVSRLEAEIFYLDETFRFGPTISALSDRVVERVDIDDKYKMFTDTNQMSEFPKYYCGNALAQNVIDICDDIQIRHENEARPFSEFNVLSRTNLPLVEFQKELARRGVPSEIRSGSLWERAEIKLLLTLIRLVNNSSLEDFIYVLRHLPSKYGVDSKKAKKIFDVATSDSIIGILNDVIEDPPFGFGDRAIKGMSSLKNVLERCEEIIKNPEVKNAFIDLAEEIEIDDCDFMRDENNEEGESNRSERWEFLELVNEFSEDQEIPMVEIETFLKMEYSTGDSTVDAVNLKTIHSSKGETLPIVYLLASTFNEYQMLKHPEDLTSELFVLYVAITRTRDSLSIWGSLPFQFDFLEDESIIEIIGEKPNRENENLERMEKAKEYLKNNHGRNLMDMEPFTVKTILRESDKAYYMTFDDDSSEWMPKSQLMYSERTDSFLAPKWLLKKKGIA